MTMKRQHDSDCQHELAHCHHCDLAYCIKCDKEWGNPICRANNHYFQFAPFVPPTTANPWAPLPLGGQGIVWSSSSDTATGSATHAQLKETKK